MANQRRRIPGDAGNKPAEKPAPKRAEGEMVYAKARPINRKKLVLQLATVAAVALAIAIGLSIFFKVDTISVSGLNKYNYNTVAEASGIQKGDSLLFFSRAEVSSKIRQALPYVNTVRIGVTLPGTVNIVIEEVAVSYAIEDAQAGWWLISADGVVVEQTDGRAVADHTVIEGVRLKSPVVGNLAVAAEEHDGESDTPVTVKGADRLAAALAVLDALENNEILGRFTSVNVQSPYDLYLWYGSDYAFKLGNTEDLNTKLAYVRSALPKILADYPAGTLDVSNPGESGGIPFTEFD